MQAIWKEAGLTAIETEVIRIRVSFSSFDDFWDSNTVPVGPSGKVLSELSPGALEQLPGLRQCREGRRSINRAPETLGEAKYS